MRSQKSLAAALRQGRWGWDSSPPPPNGFSSFLFPPQAAGPCPQRSPLNARNTRQLKHLPLADSIAYVIAWRLFPLVEREGLIQIVRIAATEWPERANKKPKLMPLRLSRLLGLHGSGQMLGRTRRAMPPGGVGDTRSNTGRGCCRAGNQEAAKRQATSVLTGAP